MSRSEDAACGLWVTLGKCKDGDSCRLRHPPRFIDPRTGNFVDLATHNGPAVREDTVQAGSTRAALAAAAVFASPDFGPVAASATPNVPVETFSFGADESAAAAPSIGSLPAFPGSEAFAAAFGGGGDGADAAVAVPQVGDEANPFEFQLDLDNAGFSAFAGKKGATSFNAALADAEKVLDTEDALEVAMHVVGADSETNVLRVSPKATLRQLKMVQQGTAFVQAVSLVRYGQPPVTLVERKESSFGLLANDDDWECSLADCGVRDGDTLIWAA